MEPLKHNTKSLEEAKVFWDLNAKDYETSWITSNDEIRFKSSDLWRFMNAYLTQQVEELTRERDKLQKFKDYVHERLDKMGVPVDPESPHKEAGCRIGGRLDFVEELKKERVLIDYVKNSGDGEFRLVLNNDAGYIHPLGRDGKTLDFKI